MWTGFFLNGTNRVVWGTNVVCLSENVNIKHLLVKNWKKRPEYINFCQKRALSLAKMPTK